MNFINLTPHTITLNDGTSYPSQGVCRVSNTFTNFINLTEYKSKYVFWEDDFCEKWHKKHSYAENETLHYPQFRAKEVRAEYVDLSRED